MLSKTRWNRPSARIVGCGVLAAFCVSLVYFGQDPYWTAGRTGRVAQELLREEHTVSSVSWLPSLDVPVEEHELEPEPDPWELVPTVNFSRAPDREYKEETEVRLKSLTECIESGRCPKNRASVRHSGCRFGELGH
jgi:hypothetical protein